MSDDIVNRVANSKLVTIDLEELYPEGERVIIDISKWLYEGLILKEKDFRKQVDEANWAQYKDKYVALQCKNEAILPSWAYLLITTKLAPYSKKIVVGELDLLESQIFQDLISKLDGSAYLDKPVIIKGCSQKPIPETAYVQLTEKLLPLAKSIMFGEACSTVPLSKKK